MAGAFLAPGFEVQMGVTPQGLAMMVADLVAWDTDALLRQETGWFRLARDVRVRHRWESDHDDS